MHPITQVLLGLGGADFLVAFFHFFEDTYLPYTETQSILGNIARANEMHHYVPYTITSSTSLELMTVTLPLACIIAGLLYVLAPQWSSRHVVLIATMFCVGIMSNVIHKYQHERDCQRPGWMTALMDAGILVSRDEHKEHHRNPTTHYGIITSLGNTVYDGLGIWNILESIIPLQRYPKPGNASYENDVPPGVKKVVEQDCPRRLTHDEVDGLYARLQKRHNTI